MVSFYPIWPVIRLLSSLTLVADPFWVAVAAGELFRSRTGVSTCESWTSVSGRGELPTFRIVEWTGSSSFLGGSLHKVYEDSGSAGAVRSGGTLPLRVTSFSPRGVGVDLWWFAANRTINHHLRTTKVVVDAVCFMKNLTSLFYSLEKATPILDFRNSK